MWKVIGLFILGTCTLGTCTAMTAAASADLSVEGVYTDEDPSAMVFRAPPGRGSDFRKALNKAIAQNPGNVVALSHRAYLFLRSGDEARARRDFAQALEVAQRGSADHRQVLWGYGWALYDMHDVDGALRMWTLCASLHPGRPHWVPYTFALAYWTRREPAIALAWYDVAVASDPLRGNAADVARLTAYWRPQQRVEMTALFDAWMAGRNGAGSP